MTHPDMAARYHAQPAGDALDTLDTTPAGLSTEEATRRLSEHGPNRLPEPPKRSPVLRFLAHFHNVLIYVLLASALVILPILPDANLGSLEGLNLRRLWTLVVLVMAINAAGYVAVRAFGPRLGLPLTGLAGGFVSSAATIGSMAQRARQTPELARGAAAAGMASNISTLVLLAIILLAGDQALLWRMGPALIASFAVTAAYAGVVGWHALQQPTEHGNGLGQRPFHFGHALAFAGLIALVLVGANLLKRWFGEAAVPVGAALAGFADTHAVAVSMAEMTASRTLAVEQASVAVLMAFTTNTLTKAALAWTAGGRKYAGVLLPGLVLMLATIWIAWATGIPG